MSELPNMNREFYDKRYNLASIPPISPDESNTFLIIGERILIPVRMGDYMAEVYESVLTPGSVE